MFFFFCPLFGVNAMDRILVNQQSAISQFWPFPFFPNQKNLFWAVLEQPGPDVIKSFSRQLWRSLESGTSASWCELIGKFYRFFFLQIYIWSFVEFQKDILDVFTNFWKDIFEALLSFRKEYLKVKQVSERYICSFIGYFLSLKYNWILIKMEKT